MRNNEELYWSFRKILVELSRANTYQCEPNGAMKKGRLTDSQDVVEKAELGPCQLVDEKVPINLLLLKQNETMRT